MKSPSRKRIPKNPLEGFALVHFFERLLDHPEFTARKMFGGLALRFRGRMIAVLAESGPDSESVWRGKKYPYPIWNGVLFPTERQHHASLQTQWPSLIPHPILPKWLYLPQSAQTFEGTLEAMVMALTKNDFRLGIEPKAPKPKPKRTRV